MTDALSVIREYQTALGQSSVGEARGCLMAPCIRTFGEQLEALEPFRTIANGWIVAPSGGGRIGSQLSEQWIAKRLLAGETPEAILASATLTVETNRYDGMEVRAIRGVTVSVRHRLTDTAYLCPNSVLPPDWRHAEAFAHPALGPGYPTETAALVHHILVEPAIVPLGGWQEPASHAVARNERSRFAHKLRLALGLVSGNPLEITAVYGAANPECVLALANSMVGGLIPPGLFADHPVDVAATRVLLGQLEAMVSPQALELSIDRLLRSRFGKSFEDRIIDLGMAAEIALMHVPKGQAGDGKSEITNKIGTRGAWLIGQNPSGRAEVYGLLNKLYSARSTVVHTGMVSQKAVLKLDAFDGLVSSIVQALLRRGAFPDWKTLVLGGG